MGSQKGGASLESLCKTRVEHEASDMIVCKYLCAFTGDLSCRYNRVPLANQVGGSLSLGTTPVRATTNYVAKW